MLFCHCASAAREGSLDPVARIGGMLSVVLLD
jgi:hypothetical protein